MRGLAHVRALFQRQGNRASDRIGDAESATEIESPSNIAVVDAGTSDNPRSPTRWVYGTFAYDGNIDAVQMVRPTPDFTDVTIDLTVWDLKHLSAIISELREKRVISRVERVVA